MWKKLNWQSSSLCLQHWSDFNVFFLFRFFYVVVETLKAFSVHRQPLMHLVKLTGTDNLSLLLLSNDTLRLFDFFFYVNFINKLFIHQAISRPICLWQVHIFHHYLDIWLRLSKIINGCPRINPCRETTNNLIQKHRPFWVDCLSVNFSKFLIRFVELL